MTVSEIIKNENFKEFEVWKYSDNTKRLHSDFIKNVDGVYSFDTYKDIEADNFYIMDEEEYNNTICANSSVYADFDSWYGNKEAKILVIMLDYTVSI